MRIPARFNGPAESGNGGFVCGVVAGLIGDGAEVTLRRPPPLDVDLRVARADGSVEVWHEERLIAEAHRVEWDIDVPAPPSLEAAIAANDAYRGHQTHEFPTCFVCGVDRPDGLHVWPGRIPGTGMVASAWRVGEDLPRHDGMLAPEVVWAALDCPGAWATLRDFTVDPVVLGRMAARITAPVEIGSTVISYGWSLGEEGRKSWAATAVADPAGRVLAHARQTWIALRS